MRTLWLAVGLALCPVSLLQAQETPKVEVFGGYSYLRHNLLSLHFNMNGWNASIAGNVTPWLGLVADFSGHYDKPFAARLSAYSALFGPRFSYRKADRVTPFAHALFGVAHGIAGVIAITPVPGGPGGLQAFTGTNFGMALGGGVDVKATQYLAIRLIQVDYFRTQFSNSHQNDARITAGIVIRFGSK